MKNQFKAFILGILAILTYFVLNFSETIPFKIADININTVPSYVKIIYMIIYEILIIALIMLIHNKKIKRDFKDILENHSKYYSSCMKYYLIGLIVMLISNSIIIFILNGDMSGNEDTIRTLFKSNPIYIYLSAVFFAPILEELIFRQSIRNIIKNNLIFIITSGLVFGGLHIINDITNFTSLLYIIPYSALGCAFAYMLYKTENIFVSMGFHFMHNGILIAMQFIILLFT